MVLKQIGRKELKLHPVPIERYRLAMNLYTLVGVAYLASTLPSFWVDTPIGPLRFVFWYSTFAFVFMGIISRRRERSQKYTT